MVSKPPGRPRKYPKVRTTTAVRFAPDTHRRLLDAADERDVSMNFLVEKAVVEFLNRLIPVDEMKWTK